MVIKNSHILYYKYFFLYVLQCEQELCWQITLQPSFLLGFSTFLCTAIKLELNYYPINVRDIKVTQAIVTIEEYLRIINSHDRIPLMKHQEIIRRILIFYQSGFSFSYFGQSFLYWMAKIAILLFSPIII
jgi:hypothetical protein